MSVVHIDPATAARLTEALTTVEVRTPDGRLIGVSTPRREATDEDYARAIAEVTTEEIEQSLQSGRARPSSKTIAELRRRFSV